MTSTSATPFCAFLKRGDRLTPLRLQLARDGLIEPLPAGTTARLYLRRMATGELVIDAPLQIEDSAQARLRYDWAEGDTDEPGGYELEVKLIDAEGAADTYPARAAVLLKIEPDLAGG